MMAVLVLTSVILLVTVALSPAGAYTEVHNLNPGDTYDAVSSRITPKLNIFCYSGKPKLVVHLWQSVVLQIEHPTEDYTQYDGESPEAVKTEHEEKQQSWSFSLFTWKQKQIKFNPFNRSCVGIESRDPYKVALNVIRIDYWKVILLVVGLALYLLADRLSKDTLFYYLCGTALGICTSFVFLFYLISKMFPFRKPVMYGVMISGWTVGAYFVRLLWDNFRTIFVTYKNYVTWYVVITGAISFIICYRIGPVKNERSKNLIRWSLQVVSLLAIFNSTQYEEAAMGQIVLLLLFYNIPPSWLGKPKRYWKRRFPPKVKLLSNDQYYEQGVRETSKALEELRGFCSSPQCNQWKVALKLKDVKRFASFIEGNSHLSDDEILEYETSIQATDLTDDDDEYTDEEP